MNDDIRFEPAERPPALLTLNVAMQGAVLIVTNVVTFIVIYAAAFDSGASDSGGSYAEWAVVGALLVAGVLTALHASRLGPGHLLLWGAGIPFMVPCILAVDAGGPALAASLAVTSSLLQMAMAAGLARLRRLITPVVAGVAFMMISLSAMPIAMRRISDVPEGASELAGTAVGVATLVVAALAMLRATGLWRLWAMPIAIVGKNRSCIRHRVQNARLRRICRPRRVRRPAGTRCAVARPSRCGQLARLRLHLRCRLLVAAAGVPGDQRRGGGTGHE